MFWILVMIGGLGLAGCVWWYFESKSSIAVLVGVVCLAIFVWGWMTPQGQVYYVQLVASGKTGNWLVIDNSGGKTLRHWILEDSYVGSSDQSDGWKFESDIDGLSYVSGDAYVGRIKRPLADFLKDYKARYNIPKDQEPLK